MSIGDEKKSVLREPIDISDGFERIGDSEVYVKDDLIVMLGTPGDNHNCDEMGCGSAGMHIVAYAKGGKETK